MVTPTTDDGQPISYSYETVMVCIECGRQLGWTHKWLCSKGMENSVTEADMLISVRKGREAP